MHQIFQSFMATDFHKLCAQLTYRETIHSDILQGPLKCMMLAIAAPIGDEEELLRQILRPEGLLSSACEHLPNAIDAASQTDQQDMLSTILRWLKRHVKGKFKTDDWIEMRTAARSIGQALRTAIRMHKTDAANTISIGCTRTKSSGTL
jgi:hypothetical protein